MQGGGGEGVIAAIFANGLPYSLTELVRTPHPGKGSVDLITRPAASTPDLWEWLSYPLSFTDIAKVGIRYTSFLGAAELWQLFSCGWELGV